MANRDTELTRQARLEEQRAQRRYIMQTTSIAVGVTLVLGVIALIRVNTSGGTTVQVQGISETSLPKPTPITESSTTVDDSPSTTIRTTPTTVAPTTTTAPAIPPNLIDLFTTTTVLPTTTVPVTVPAAANIKWSASPSTLRLQSGAQGIVNVTAVNIGNANGTATAPGCPGKPQSFAAFATVCAQGGQVVDLAPGQANTWTVTISATDNGTRQGNPLAPGRYLVAVGSTAVVLQVSA